MSSSWYFRIATVTAAGINGITSSASTGPVPVSPHHRPAYPNTTRHASTSHSNCRRSVSSPRRYLITSDPMASEDRRKRDIAGGPQRRQTVIERDRQIRRRPEMTQFQCARRREAQLEHQAFHRRCPDRPAPACAGWPSIREQQQGHGQAQSDGQRPGQRHQRGQHSECRPVPAPLATRKRSWAPPADVASATPAARNSHPIGLRGRCQASSTPHVAKPTPIAPLVTV